MTLPLPVLARPGTRRRVLGIDPGSACGWAVLAVSELGAVTVERSGTWDLTGRGRRHPGYRFQRLLDQTQDLVREVDVVAYELVHRHLGTQAAHVYGGIVAVLLLACADAGKPVVEVPVAHVKQRATGKGNASKSEMIEAARPILGREPLDDNEADGLFVALVAADEAADWFGEAQ